MKGFQIESKDADYICLTNGEEVSEEQFQEWLNGIFYKASTRQTLSKEIEPKEVEALLLQIKQYPLAAKTPLETQQFLWEIQLKLYGSL